MFLQLLTVFLLAVSDTLANGTAQERFDITGYAQGTTYNITYYASDSLLTRRQADSLFQVIDQSMSLYKPHSLINAFNGSKQGIVVDKHLEKVFHQSVTIWKESDGLFDITVQPLVKAWGFGNKEVTRYPNRRKVRSLLKCVGMGKLQMNGQTLSKSKSCITIDVNGIAQGYTVDVIADFLKAAGGTDFIVEVGGELRVEGRKPDGSLMKIGIEAPGDYDEDIYDLQKIIQVEDCAITTSGNYRKYRENNGKRFSHTINPKTGYPIDNELISVTVIAPTAMEADGYDNVLMAMGLQRALQFVENRKDLAAYFIYKKPDGSIGDIASTAFQKYLLPTD